MGRLLIFLELAAVVCGVAFFSVWGRVSVQLALLPLAVVVLLPSLCVLAVWPLQQVQLALRDGWGSNPFRMPAFSSLEVWKFSERIAPPTGVFAFLLFLVLALARGLPGNQAAIAGLCAAEAAAVFLTFQAVRGTVESLVRREREFPQFDLSPSKLRDYSISFREREVAQLLVTGLRYGEIGQRLFISIKTVKTHVHRLYEKTGTRNRMELANVLRA
jgi:DNA-binding CsgD family transcriptional regulator